jgi:hypothetical protein
VQGKFADTTLRDDVANVGWAVSKLAMLNDSSGALLVRSRRGVV